MLRATPMTVDEFKNGAEGDVLKTVFMNGKVVDDQSWFDIKMRAKITELDGSTAFFLFFTILSFFI